MLTHPKRSLPWLETQIDRTQNKIEVNVFVNFVSARGLDVERFVDLSQAAKNGIERYWSRAIEMDDEPFRVYVQVVPRRTQALKIKLAFTQAARYARSHNSGIICACVKFNAGFFRDETQARASFVLTAAHEFGHSILYAARGWRHSWGHKGTGAVLLQRPRKTAPAYPAKGEIDLMCYYNAPAVDFNERATRSRASSQDVAALVRLGMQKD